VDKDFDDTNDRNEVSRQSATGSRGDRLRHHDKWKAFYLDRWHLAR